MTTSVDELASVLIATSGSRRCALPLASVVETMRPLPVAPLAGAPACVRGLSIIRGAALPVLSLGALLGEPGLDAADTRFVTVRTEGRCFALAVSQVLGVRDIATVQLDALPALLQHADRDAIEAIGVADAQLLILLRGAWLVPDATWDAVQAAAGTDR